MCWPVLLLGETALKLHLEKCLVPQVREDAQQDCAAAAAAAGVGTTGEGELLLSRLLLLLLAGCLVMLWHAIQNKRVTQLGKIFSSRWSVLLNVFITHTHTSQTYTAHTVYRVGLTCMVYAED